MNEIERQGCSNNKRSRNKYNSKISGTYGGSTVVLVLWELGRTAVRKLDENVAKLWPSCGASGECLGSRDMVCRSGFFPRPPGQARSLSHRERMMTDCFCRCYLYKLPGFRSLILPLGCRKIPRQPVYDPHYPRREWPWDDQHMFLENVDEAGWAGCQPSQICGA